jgi:sugar phosphate isomerase/epimerase
VLHVHARDGVRDLAQGRGLETPLGRGATDFPGLMGALEQHQYQGFFTIERENADDPLGEIGQAVSYLQSLAT